MQRVLKKKRSRANVKNSAVKINVSLAPEPTTKKGKAAPAVMKPDVVSGNCDDDLCKMPDTDRHRPLEIFQFPWQKEERSLEPELEGCSFTDVFFSSLVDGCSAAIGFPGDRLSLPMASPVNLPQASNEDPEDTDYIWSSILQQPLSFVYSIKDSGN